ncbi:hypothetical protein EIO_1666 [Ketogulonicigenium vulgare Y25]|uniref:Uncharacterized protein n=1 Tax=Ketogulonicigenium vulgare (strain WSH-001) TaxID=759362 RepID=F9Y6V8_KETVW|nr:hypothetical protein EIO_1666 [Ketogulonicigenium vulgare Y25]AEM40975.1 hypothetical protein KVU_1136 [Ketogulonicigenium vulgare WSH-001]ALJ81126.1 hypothetical protein KVH_08020 [Ketogulonicigenium vulgare]ANW35049.1 hypothetical protein KvSKV_07990 [Ketogulonicigenium vulgare]AOZ54701.1 hypothetical protein KVC_1688 [Ketogulonicigenium vulgare]
MHLLCDLPGSVGNRLTRARGRGNKVMKAQCAADQNQTYSAAFEHYGVRFAQ